MIPKPISSKAPSLGAQASRAVLWNVLFVPLRMIAEITATLIKLSVMAQPSFGMISLINATNNGLGTWIDLGTGRALPKFIPETARAGGPRAVSRLLLVALGAQMVLLSIIGTALIGLRAFYLDYLRGQVTKAIATPISAQQVLLEFIDRWNGLLI